MNDAPYEDVARLGKAIGHGTRLELLELLAQAEQSVETMAGFTGAGVTSVSAHLQVLKGAGLVLTRREGTRIFYRLADPDVAGLFVALKAVAARTAGAAPDALTLARLAPSELKNAVVLDVRPEREYRAGHFAGAVSLPLAELPARAGELPAGRPVIIYCRGEFCHLAAEAAEILRGLGVDARALDEGILEWRSRADIALEKSA